MFELMVEITHQPIYREVFIQHRDSRLRFAIVNMVAFASYLISYHNKEHRRAFMLLYDVKELVKEALVFNASDPSQRREKVEQYAVGSKLFRGRDYQNF